MRTGDGWTVCGFGHRHWGRYGAAGLMILDTDRVMLQHRAPWTHEGDSWGVLGGARDEAETAVDAALREAHEEAGIDGALVDPVAVYVDDHQGWAYTTVVARPLADIEPGAINAESVSVQWHRLTDVPNLKLHSGFAGAWRHLHALPPPLFLIIDVDLQRDPLVREIATEGVLAARLPDEFATGGFTRLLPKIVTEDPADGQVLRIGSRDDLVRIA